MSDNYEIEKLVGSFIEANHKLGDQAGGSGHLSFVSYFINDIKTQELMNGKKLVRFSYTISVESEFTIYPDNPPYESHYSMQILVDDKNQIIEEKEIEVESKWKETKENILKYLVDKLQKIEWQYGDNRAPFKYPPRLFEHMSIDNVSYLTCLIEPDLVDGEPPIVIESDNPVELIEKLKQAIDSMTGSVE